MRWKSIAIAPLLAASCCFGPATAEPVSEPKDAITRGEFVTEIEAILNKAEAEHQNYVTKSEMTEFRALLMQLREEIGGLGERESVLDDNVQRLDERSKETRRPRL